MGPPCGSSLCWVSAAPAPYSDTPMGKPTWRACARSNIGPKSLAWPAYQPKYRLYPTESAMPTMASRDAAPPSPCADAPISQQSASVVAREGSSRLARSFRDLNSALTLLGPLICVAVRSISLPSDQRMMDG